MERPVGGIAAHSPRHHAFVHEKEAKREEKEIARGISGEDCRAEEEEPRPLSLSLECFNEFKILDIWKIGRAHV